MYRTSAGSVAAIALLLFSGTAAADPVAPQSDTPCPPDAVGAMTWPADAKQPLTCAGGPSGGQWQTVATPAPPSDRWLSVGPAMTLHGEGRRNPDVRSGDWTATPRNADTRCRVEQSTVIGPGVVGTPEIAEGPAGRRLEVQFAPRLFDLTLSGDCLWARASG